MLRMFIARIREKIEYYRDHQFVRNTAILQVISMAANVFQALAGIALARILQPDLFGVYALSFGLAGLISVFLGLGASDAVLTIASEAHARHEPEKIREAFAFLAKITVILGVVALVGALFAPLIASRLYHNSMIGMYAAVVVVASLISTTAYSFTTIGLQIARRIRPMALLGLMDQVTRTSLALLFVLVGLKVFGIVLGHLLGASLVCIVSAIMWRKLSREVPEFPTIKQLLQHVRGAALKKYFGFSVWIAIDRNLSNLYNILPVMIAGIYVSTTQVTFFKLGFAYMNLGLGFLGPIGTLLNSEFPKMKAQSLERMGRNFVRVSLYGLALSTGIAVAAAIAAPLAFRILYGVKFMQSVPFVYGFLPYTMIMGLGIGLGSSFRALNKVKFSIGLHIVNLGIGVPIALLLTKHFGPWGMVASVTIWYLIAILTAFFYINRHLRNLQHE
jgi:O-antigen/teichoic acid export membrane protein